jgi:hypothetical protein|tara:strand:+ start:14793 stop:16319 length:1527 start_codon:yes stop_codon:yes gene_type:complete
MGAYENPTYYGIAQDYTAFNKAMMGAFDRYTSIYMQMQKATATQEGDTNQGYYKLLETLTDVPEKFNMANTRVFGLDGTVRSFLPGANDDQKRGIESLVVGVRGAYNNINDFYENPEKYLELDVESKIILNGLPSDKTKIQEYSDPKNPWGNIYFSHPVYGNVSVTDIGQRLALAERDFSNENFGRQIVNGSVSTVTNQIEFWQNQNKRNAFAGSNERNDIIEKYSDNLKIGENWAGYWHNEMEAADKIIPVEGEAKDAYLKIKSKNKLPLDSNTIDLSMFGFSFVDFSDADNKILKKLRDIAIRKHIEGELKNQVTPDFYTLPGDNTTQTQIKLNNETDIRQNVIDLSNSYNKQPVLGPVTNFNTGASGFLNYLQKNKIFPSANNFQNYEISDRVLENYLTGNEGLTKAKQIIIERISKSRFGIEYADLNQKERKIVDDLVKESIAVYEEAANSNKVFKASDGSALDFRNFINDLSFDIYNNNKYSETLIDPRIPNEEGTTLPVFQN